MYLQEIGHCVREARRSRKLTQDELAKRAGLSRTTLNQFENGNCLDLGVKKLMALLDVLGLDVQVAPAHRGSKQDYLKLACVAANVSYREHLAPDELAHALLSGRIPASRRPHLRVVFDELPEPVFQGLVDQVASWGKPEEVKRNVEAIALAIDSARRVAA